MSTTWRWLGSLPKLGISLVFLFAFSHADIPLPEQGLEQDKGIVAGMGFGAQNHVRCKTLWTWTGYGQYSYSSFLSGGMSIKFLGGNLDSANILINQRYSLDAKFMYSQPRYVLFAGPVISFENTNLSVLRKEFANTEDTDGTDGAEDSGADTECRDFFTKIGSSVGYQSGIAYLITPNWGLSFGHNSDITLKGLFIVSFSGAIAFNLRERFEKLIENTRNVWLSLEYSTTLVKNRIKTHDLIFGLAVGF